MIGGIKVNALKILLFCFLAFSLAGCGFTNNKVQEEEKESRIQVKNTVDHHIDRKSGQEIAKHLVELASSVPNVNDATAVVIGKFAVVGIDVNSNLDRSRVSTIKYSVTESLQHDPYGANAVVFADADTYERLKQMKKEIQNGRPIAGVLDELAQIVGRVMPDIPNEIIDNQNTNPTKTNDKQLNKDEEKQLKQKQQEHSNNKKND